MCRLNGTSFFFLTACHTDSQRVLKVSKVLKVFKVGGTKKPIAVCDWLFYDVISNLSYFESSATTFSR